jgi:restriction system protein
MGRGRYNAYVELERQRAAAARRQAAEVRSREVQERRENRLRLQAHLQGRQQEAEELNEELHARVQSVETVLQAALGHSSALDLEELKRPMELPLFDAQGADQPAPEPRWEHLKPKAPGFLAKLLPGATSRYQASVIAAEQAFQAKLAEWTDYEPRRLEWLRNAKAEYESACGRLRLEIEAQHADVEAFRSSYQAGDPEAVRQYFTIVLDRDELPQDFPQEMRVAYMAEPRQLVVERQLPTVDVIPEALSHRYVRVSDSFTSSRRPATQTRSLYVSAVAQMALRTLHLIFTADAAGILAAVVLNCIVDTVSPETGHRIKPCLLTVKASREDFSVLDLSNVEPAADTSRRKFHRGPTSSNLSVRLSSSIWLIRASSTPPMCNPA